MSHEQLWSLSSIQRRYSVNACAAIKIQEDATGYYHAGRNDEAKEILSWAEESHRDIHCVPMGGATSGRQAIWMDAYDGFLKDLIQHLSGNGRSGPAHTPPPPSRLDQLRTVLKDVREVLIDVSLANACHCSVSRGETCLSCTCSIKARIIEAELARLKALKEGK